MPKEIKVINCEPTIEEIQKDMHEIEKLLNKKNWKIDRIRNQTYYHVNYDGVVEDWTEYFDDANNYHYLTGNYFLTEEAAEGYKAYLKALGRVNLAILEANDGWEPNWDDHHEAKCFIYYDTAAKEFRVNCICVYKEAFAIKYIRTTKLAEEIISRCKDDLLLIFNYK